MFGLSERTTNKGRLKKRVTGLLLVAIFAGPLAAQAAGKPIASSMDDPTIMTMVIISIILLLIIGLLSYVLVGAAGFMVDKDKKEPVAGDNPGLQQSAGNGSSTTAAKVVAGMTLLFFSLPLFAQDAAAVTTGTGTTDTGFYFLTGVIFLELVVIIVLLYNLRSLLVKQKTKQAVKEGVEYKLKPKTNWWTKINKFRPLEQEAQLDLGHEYDGIRELDNRLPPWWLYGFYATIIFGVIYLWRYHVSQTAPLSVEEYQIAVAKAEKEKEAYLKKAANLVDENNVTLLTDDASLTAGKKVFVSTCAACHGQSGEGNSVGPNLIDNYWLHGGGLKNVFKSVKYGWPEKGMLSWKETLSPSQMAQVSSYIISLHGTNPPNAKAPQGELYTGENETATDSTVVNTDSVTVSQ